MAIFIFEDKILLAKKPSLINYIKSDGIKKCPCLLLHMYVVTALLPYVTVNINFVMASGSACPSSNW